MTKTLDAPEAALRLAGVEQAFGRRKRRGQVLGGVSLEVAGWILSQNMDRHGNTWKAIGAYNAVTPSKQLKYAERVFQNLPDHVRTAR